jgi:hypothetical protein
MAVQERGAEREGQQQNQRDGGQSLIGDRFSLALGSIGFRAMPAGM